TGQDMSRIALPNEMHGFRPDRHGLLGSFYQAAWRLPGGMGKSEWSWLVPPMPGLRRRTAQAATTSKTAINAAGNKASWPNQSMAVPARTGPHRLPAQLMARYQALARARSDAGSRSPRRARPSG